MNPFGSSSKEQVNQNDNQNPNENQNQGQNENQNQGQTQDQNQDQNQNLNQNQNQNLNQNQSQNQNQNLNENQNLNVDPAVEARRNTPLENLTPQECVEETKDIVKRLLTERDLLKRDDLRQRSLGIFDRVEKKGETDA